MVFVPELEFDIRVELEVVVDVGELDDLEIREVEVIVPELETIEDSCDEDCGTVDVAGAVDVMLFDVDAGVSVSMSVSVSVVSEVGVGETIGSGT